MTCNANHRKAQRSHMGLSKSSLTPSIETQTIHHETASEIPIIDKVEIINKMKNQIDSQNKETLEKWVKGSIEFGQKQLGIKTLPKSDSLEDFYDWLVDNSIIDINGNPLPKR